jgi:hypothetical protein
VLIELPVIRAAYELALELARRVEKFPRHQRTTLGGELARQARDILNALVRARYSTPAARPALLAEANAELEVLRFGLRLACDLKALPFAGHGHLIRLADAVGSQVGGWRKAAAGS